MLKLKPTICNLTIKPFNSLVTGVLISYKYIYLSLLVIVSLNVLSLTSASINITSFLQFLIKIFELFKEFEALNPRDFESVFKSGKTLEGRSVESKSMGPLNPEMAQSLAKAFKEGIKLLPKIFEALPELLKKFDEDLTKEATERVDKKLEEEKAKIEEGKKKEEKPEEPKLEGEPKVSEGEIPPSEIKLEVNPTEGGNIESPKA